MVLNARGIGMDRLIEADVSAVRVAEDARVDQGMIEVGVEERPLLHGAAFDEEAAQPRIPGGACSFAHRIEIPIRTLGGQVRLRALDADERQPDLHQHDLPCRSSVEHQVCARPRAGAGARALLERAAIPGPEGGERPAEARRKVDLVVEAATALAARRRAPVPFSPAWGTLPPASIITVAAAEGGKVKRAMPVRAVTVSSTRILCASSMTA